MRKYALCRRELLFIYALMSFCAFLIYIYQIHNASINNGHFKQRECKAQQKIAFVKTHKCASSTVQNILFRFGFHRNLTFVLPLTGNYLGYRTSFQHSMIERLPWHHLGYDIFALHTVWNQKEVEVVMGNSTTYISIVRDPVFLFESLYSYTDLDKLLGMNVTKFANTIQNENVTDLRKFSSLGRNQILYDFGLSLDDCKNFETVEKKIQDIDATFAIIMIAEYIEESLVLLKDLLCWDLQDVTFLWHNVRKEKFKTTLSEDAIQKLRKWLWADQMFYDHFLSKLHQMKLNYGVFKLKAEVELLRQMNLDIKKQCEVSASVNSNRPNMFQPWNRKAVGYKVNNTTMECQIIAMNEFSFIELLRKRQFIRSGYSEAMQLPVNPLALNIDTHNLTAMENVFKKLYIHSNPQNSST